MTDKNEVRDLIGCLEVAVEGAESYEFRSVSVANLKAAIDLLSAQAGQEPVVWQETDEHGEPQWNESSFGQSRNDFDYSMPLYAAPIAQAASVPQGLTDEHILDIARDFLEWTEVGYAISDKVAFARALLAQAAPPATPVQGDAQEHYDEVKATLQGAHRIMESLSAIERRVGPVGSHARGYTHKITNALRHLDALLAASAAPAIGDSQHLANLLARIHQDGGHYQAKHGTEQAVDDADHIVAELHAKFDEVTGESGMKKLDRLERVLDGYEDMPNATSAQQDEREALTAFPFPWRVVQGNKGVTGVMFKPVDIRSANNHTLFRVGNGDYALPLANLIVAMTAQQAQAGGEDKRPQTAAARDVLAERRRQIEKEGWMPPHDDEHSDGQMAVAAACYAVTTNQRAVTPAWWPWEDEWWKPKDYRRNLVRAGALILAEIERLDRAALSREQPQPSNGDREGGVV